MTAIVVEAANCKGSTSQIDFEVLVLFDGKGGFNRNIRNTVKSQIGRLDGDE
ncbi:unnamed protein product [Dovyalis caffra]|uniref:Uncharacterized protein n=1 Tax=Dovyalis caffra TaxID=77055 RepID=A0AAV1SF90_9ROSI|nr:unnamed protein product [Dovyalis caffra]